MIESSENVTTEEPKESETYCTPSLVEIGSVVELTLGGGSIQIWDSSFAPSKEPPF